MLPWAAERAVGPEEARALIASHFPELAHFDVVLEGEGWDNTAFLAGPWIFRFPRRQIAVPLIDNECLVLPLLQSLPLPVPNPVWVARPDGGWPFAGYRRLPGQMAVGAGDETRMKCAAPLGEFLRALHAVPPPDGLPGDVIGRLDVPERAALARERAPELELDILDIPPPSKNRPRRLVHGDLYARHILIEDGRPSGIIDWGDVHLGDPAVDLMVAFSFLGPDARARFFEAYGPIDEETERLARFRAVTHSVALRMYAAGIGDRALAAEAERAITGT